MIHYHGLPVSGSNQDAIEFLDRRHALISFAAPSQIAIAGEMCMSFCLDNGAYTAWKKGKPVTDWTPYYEWVKLWCLHPGFDFAI